MSELRLEITDITSGDTSIVSDSDIGEFKITDEIGLVSSFELGIDNEDGIYTNLFGPGSEITIHLHPGTKETVIFGGIVQRRDQSDPVVLKLSGQSYQQFLVGPLMTRTFVDTDGGNIIRTLGQTYAPAVKWNYLLDTTTVYSGVFTKKLEELFLSLSDVLNFMSYTIKVRPDKEVLIYPIGTEPSFLNGWTQSQNIWRLIPDNAGTNDDGIHVTDGELHLRGLEQGIRSEKVTASDGSLTGKFKIGPTGSGQAIIAFRWTEGGLPAEVAKYTIAYQAATDTVQFRRVLENGTTIIDPFVTGIVIRQEDPWHTFKIDFLSSDCSIYLDDVLVLTASGLTKTTPGWVGLSTDIANGVDYDDFKWTNPITGAIIMEDGFDFNSQYVVELPSSWVHDASNGLLQFTETVVSNISIAVGGGFANYQDFIILGKWRATGASHIGVGFRFYERSQLTFNAAGQTYYRLLDGALHRREGGVTSTVGSTWPAVGSSGAFKWYKVETTGSKFVVNSSTDGTSFTERLSTYDGRNEGTIGTDAPIAAYVSDSPFSTGMSLDFTGTRSTTRNVIRSTFQSYPTTAETITFWFKSPNEAENLRKCPYSYAVSGSDNENTIFFEPLDQGEGQITFSVKTNSVTFTPTFTEIADNLWHHMAITWASSGSASLFIDGALKTTQTISSGSSIGTGGTLVLGQDQDSLGGTFNTNDCFAGFLDDVRLYNRVLSRAEIVTVAQGGGLPRNGMVSWWKFDDGTVASIARDDINRLGSLGRLSLHAMPLTDFDDFRCFMKTGDFIGLESDTEEFKLSKEQKQVVNRITVIGDKIQETDDFSLALGKWTNIAGTWSTSTLDGGTLSGTVSTGTVDAEFETVKFTQWDSANNTVNILLKQVTNTFSPGIKVYKSASDFLFCKMTESGSASTLEIFENGTATTDIKASAVVSTTIFNSGTYETWEIVQNGSNLAWNVNGTEYLQWHAAAIRENAKVRLVVSSSASESRTVRFDTFLVVVDRTALGLAQDFDSINNVGKKELIITDSGIKSPADASTRANNELLVRKVETTSVDVSIDGTLTFFPGDLINVSSTVLKLFDTPYQVVQVTQNITDQWTTTLKLSQFIPELVRLLIELRSEQRRLSLFTTKTKDLIEGFAESMPAITESIVTTTQGTGSFVIGTARVGFSDVA